jgi:pyruvate kinase
MQPEHAMVSMQCKRHRNTTNTLRSPSSPLALHTPGATGKDGVISVNYDGFIDDVSTGDELLVDGGIISFVVRGKTDTDVQVSCLFGRC